MENNEFEVTLDSAALAELKYVFNETLQSTLMTMQAKESNAATITVKLTIELGRVFLQTRTICTPRFDYKVCADMHIKSGQAGRWDENFELLFDEGSGSFFMKPICDGQETMFAQ